MLQPPVDSSRAPSIMTTATSASAQDKTGHVWSISVDEDNCWEDLILTLGTYKSVKFATGPWIAPALSRHANTPVQAGANVSVLDHGQQALTTLSRWRRHSGLRQPSHPPTPHARHRRVRTTVTGRTRTHPRLHATNL